MRRFAHAAVVMVLSSVLAVPLAFAEDLLTRAQALDNDYIALQARFDADTEPHSVLAADLDALDARLSPLQAERDALGQCSCAEIDSHLSHATSLSVNMRNVLGSWEEE